MKKKTIKKFVEIPLIMLLFLGCVSIPSQTTMPPSTTQSPPTTTFSAHFEIIDLRVAPENPKVGDTLIILVDVQNKGDSSGSYTVLVRIGSKSKTQNIELEGKASKTVQFQDTVDTEGDIEIKAGDLIKKIFVAPLETSTTTPPPTTPTPTTPAPTTPKPTAAPEEKNRIDRPAYDLGTRLNYLFMVRGNEWGCTISYMSSREEDRTPWFRWGVTDYWNPNPRDTYWRGDYTYIYDGGWDLEEVVSFIIGGHKFTDDVYLCAYNPHMPCVFPLVKGAEKIDTGRIYSFMYDLTSTTVVTTTGGGSGGSLIEGYGTYERRIYIEDFEEIETGGETYRCAKVKYYMKHSLEFKAPYINEDWGKIEWIEEGYHWYSEIGLVKAEVTIKTYWWDELEKTDKVSIILTAATLP